MFLRNYWYVAAHEDEVGRRLMQRSILGEPVLMYRREDGTPVAMHNACPHRSMPLSEGTLIGDDVQCGYHGLCFGPDGKCNRIPGQPNIPPRARVRTYPIVQKWRYLWIWTGDPKKADDSAIPDFHWNSDPDWTWCGGQFHIKCNYQLLVENLLDLSHETFVHPTTIGSQAIAEAPARADAGEQCVRVMRQVDDQPAPPLYLKVKGYDGNINRTQNIEFTPPTNIVIESRSVPTGSNDPDMVMEYRVLNGITPATHNTTHHFWSVPRNFAPDPDLTVTFQKGSHQALSEDVGILEKQQAMIEAQGGNPKWVDINVDQGPVLARRMVSKLMKDEEAKAGA